MPRIVVALMLACVGLLSGCDSIGLLAEAVAPPKLIEAKYDLPDKPTLVVVDAPSPYINNDAMLYRIAAATQAALEAEGVVTAGFVGLDQLDAYKQQLGPKYATTSLAALAMHLDAKQVIAVEVYGYNMSMGGTIIRPKVSMKVRVFDLDEAKTVFPASIDPDTGAYTGATAYDLTTQLPAQDLADNSSTRSIATLELADMAGRDVARLFFDWRVEAVGSNLGRR